MIPQQARRALQDGGESGRRSQHGDKKHKGLEALRALRESSDYLNWILTFGSVFAVPDALSGFSRKEEPGREHYWVLASNYGRGQATIVAYPITSQTESSRTQGLFLPGGAVSHLERDGTILIGRPFRRVLPVAYFREPTDCRSIGRLPPEWRAKFASAITTFGEEFNGESAEP